MGSRSEETERTLKMSDQLLRDLGRLARQRGNAGQAPLDERWDRLAAGTLTTEEEAELRKLAETSAEASEAYEAFRPLGAEFQARMVDALATELRRDGRAVKAWEWRAALWPFRRAGTSLKIAWSAAGGLAAIALLLILRSLISLPALPQYAAKLSSGDQYLRGTTGAARHQQIPLFTPGSRLRLDLTPSRAVAGPVEARAFVEHDGRLSPWAPQPHLEIAESGAVSLSGIVGEDIRLPPGVQRVLLVAGRPGKMPEIDELQAELRAGRLHHADWQAGEAWLRIADAPPP
jgi:hypothetical protein